MVYMKPEEASKLFVGINFYGQDYTIEAETGYMNANPIVSDQYLKLVKQYTPQISKLYKFLLLIILTWPVEWDQQGSEHYFEYTVNNNEQHKVYYPSLKSIDLKLQMIREHKFGVAIWEIGQGQGWFFDLL